ncbi:MAG: RNA polymerase factor sigma-54 [Cellvibrionales bacterium]|nr:RNA polymerase factor sigma-54 [Cellvibrionales bacterium]
MPSKQSLHLGVSQRLKMTARLQESLRLLQLPSAELRQEIQEQLYSNPMLEIDEEASLAENEAEHADTEPPLPPVQSPDGPEAEFHSLRRGSDLAADWSAAENVRSPSLHEHLRWQLGLAHLSAADMQIGAALIDAIDGQGLLRTDCAELARGLKPVPAVAEVEAVLRRIQHLDPPGVGARDLRECLLIQLDLLTERGEHWSAARRIVERFLPQASRADLRLLGKQTSYSEAQVRGALDLIKRLNPRPGANFSEAETGYIIPDLTVAKIDGQWTVQLCAESLPRLRCHSEYGVYLSRAAAGDRDYLCAQMQAAKGFLRSLAQRQETLLRVARAILAKQHAFFEHGSERLCALRLQDLAAELGLHESTISRATQQKYLSCPAGILELRFFFSARGAEGANSATAIRALIARLIEGEDPQKPLSDSALAACLRERGIAVARRTVAKYREMQGIGPARLRRRFA